MKFSIHNGSRAKPTALQEGGFKIRSDNKPVGVV